MPKIRMVRGYREMVDFGVLGKVMVRMQVFARTFGGYTRFSMRCPRCQTTYRYSMSEYERTSMVTDHLSWLVARAYREIHSDQFESDRAQRTHHYLAWETQRLDQEWVERQKYTNPHILYTYVPLPKIVTFCPGEKPE